MQSGSISLAETCRFNTLAPILAEQVLIKIEKDILAWSEDKGNFGEAYPGFGWICEIADVPLHDPDVASKESGHQLKKIIVTITGASGQPPFKAETWRVVFD